MRRLVAAFKHTDFSVRKQPRQIEVWSNTYKGSKAPMDIIHQHFNSLDSTNTWAKKHASEYARDKLTLITAEEQTAGRGRQGRSWLSPKGKNIYASLCLFVNEFNPQLTCIPHVLALSALRALQKYDVQLQLKWPNDLMLSGKKVGGVLCETRVMETMTTLILGIGININMPKEPLESLNRPATSLMIEKNHSYDVHEIIKAIAQQFAGVIDDFLKLGFAPFFKQYCQHLIHQPGDPIQFHISANKFIEGIFHSIQDNGSINLQMQDGSMCTFLSGEIV